MVKSLDNIRQDVYIFVHVYILGIEDLPLDHVMVNTLDMEAILKMQIICTSCKAKEKAVARCSDCANFLCPNCVTAHQYMRCFENHKVLDEHVLML